MIRVDRPEENARQIHLFLSPWEIELIEDYAAQQDDWTQGRQASCYFKLDIKEDVEAGSFIEDLGWFKDIGDHALDELRRFTKVTELDEKWDAYLLYYPNTSRVPAHKDPAPEGFKHVRLNAVVRPPKEGGKFIITRRSGCRETNFFYDMATPGEAMIFSPSEAEHEVTRMEGPRLVLSFGCLVPA